MTREAFEKLQTEAQQGIETSFNQFFAECYPVFIRQLTGMTQSEAAARDAFMDALYKFWKKLVNGELGYRENLKGYLFVMAKNEWLQRKRTEKKQATFTLQADEVELYLAKQPDNKEEENYNPLLQNELDKLLNKKQQQRVLAISAAFEELGEKCKRILRDTIVYKIKLKSLQHELGYASYNALKVAKYQCKASLLKKVQAKLRIANKE